MNQLAVITEPVAPAFDYSTLPDDIAYRQKERAHRIQTMKRATVEAAAEMGRVLMAAQEELEHGQFFDWVVMEAGLSKSVAYRFMDMVRNLGPKLPILGNLPVTTIQKIAAAPTETRDEIVSAFDRGEVLPAPQIESMIATARQGAKLTKQQADKAARRARVRESDRRYARSMVKQIFEEAATDLEKAQREHEAAKALLVLLGDKRHEAIKLLRQAGYGNGRGLESQASEPRLLPNVAAMISGTKLDTDVYRQHVAFLDSERQRGRVERDLNTIARADRLG